VIQYLKHLFSGGADIDADEIRVHATLDCGVYIIIALEVAADVAVGNATDNALIPIRHKKDATGIRIQSFEGAGDALFVVDLHEFEVSHVSNYNLSRL